MKSRRLKRRHDRRATILLMVVTLLALLFVIVTGFLAVARNDRGNVKQVLEGDVAGTIVKDTIDLTTDLVTRQLVDSDGNVLGGSGGNSYSYEDIPGYRFSNYLASLEPIWDPDWTGPSSDSQGKYATWATGGSWSIIDRMQWPAVTSLDAGITSPTPFRLWQLLWDYNARKAQFRKVDIKWNAREGFADADGDGMPDSHYLLGALATELANNKTGRYVNIPDYDYLAAIPGNEGDFKLYDQFGGIFAGTNPAQIENTRQQILDNIRYQVAVRVVSHGGMVSLDSPTVYQTDYIGDLGVVPFNRSFVMGMFDATRSTRDTNTLSDYYTTTQDQNTLFDGLTENAADVELTLRRRFLLPPPQQWGDNGNDKVRALPAVLEDLFDQFSYTFLQTFARQSAGGDELDQSYERINLADADDTEGSERYGWAKAISYNPVSYNQGENPQVNHEYDRRHILTSISRSDELARKQVSEEPSEWLELNTAGDHSALYEGELKFYLGEVAKAFDVNSPGTGQYEYNPYRGGVIIQNLARYYFEMLASHSSGSGTDDWNSLFTSISSSDGEQGVSRREQALMLAVNTVAFASPRDMEASGTAGYIDTVTYTDNNGTPADTNDDVTYIGYAPQPFITEVIAFNEERDQNGDPDEISIAVELYNPNDPYIPSGGTVLDDPFALYLPQFGITIDEVNGGPMLPVSLAGHGTGSDPADGPDKLPGRSFTTVTLKPAQSNGHFDTVSVGGTEQIVSTTGSISLDTSEPKLTIKLWRFNRDLTTKYLIDWVEIDNPNPQHVGMGSDKDDIWTSVCRDTSYRRDPSATGAQMPPTYGGDPVHGTVLGTRLPHARWNVVLGQPNPDIVGGGFSSPPDFVKSGSARNAGSPALATLGGATGLWASGTVFDPDGNFLVAANKPIAPTVPLITMNAGPYNDLALFGNDFDLRPRSYPTVGFLLFVPRFSHTYHATSGSYTMSDALYKQWLHHDGTYDVRQALSDYPEYPADFGHMPVFDNQQSVATGTYLDQVGELPWGLLVFDYFTTIDPLRDLNADGDPDADVLEVPGRVNINTASWFVLSKLPMLGPVPAGDMVGGILPIIPRLTSDLDLDFPSPSFWDSGVGMFVGWGGWDPDEGFSVLTERQLLTEVVTKGYALQGRDMPYLDSYAVGNQYRLGAWLAQSAAGYRDRMKYLPSVGYTYSVYADAVDHNVGPDYRPAEYGSVRDQGTTPTKYGFVSIGEFLNVEGFDASLNTQLTGSPLDTTLGKGDYLRSISLLVLLDSQYLTTRSNTFTVYTSVIDREQPQRSVHSQTTIDRSNMLPRLTYAFYDSTSGVYYPVADYLADTSVNKLPVVPQLRDLDGNGVPETPVRLNNANEEPRVIAHEEVGYFNAAQDN